VRNSWEIIRPDKLEEEHVGESGDTDGVIDFIKDIPDMLLEAGKEMLSRDDNPEDIRDISELSADERFAIFDEQYEKGIIDHPEWEDKFWRHIHEAAEEQFKSDLESAGLPMEALADLSEDFQILERHDIETMDKKDELRTRLETGELETTPAQELVDEMLEDERISEDAHRTISRTIELSKKMT